MLEGDLSVRLRDSLASQDAQLRSSLVLNPVENFPFADDLAVIAGTLHGLYNSDKLRIRSKRVESPIQFAGRQRIEADCRTIYDAWAKALGAEDATLRLLSGLHAHIVLFMALARSEETVLLLPVEAGGHVATKSILERLGLTVVDMIANEDAMSVDISATMELIESRRPQYLFVDRSEGLTYEDFSPLAAIPGVTSIFDASQYLTSIVCGDFPNPLTVGFDLLVASLHKNFPGPQKALLATRSANQQWHDLLGGISTYVSNMHVASTYAAALTLDRRSWLEVYSKRIQSVAVALEQELIAQGVPAVERNTNAPPTHHLWIREASKEAAFESYEALEACRILTNFRLLPYSLGYGLRLGVSAAVRLGFTEEDVPELADLIANIRDMGATSALRARAKEFNENLWARI